jgi:hypothetical protein
MEKLKTFESFDQKPVQTNKWKYELVIKDQLTEDSEPEKIIELSNTLVRKLTKLKEKVEKSNLVEDEIENLVEEFERIIDNFDFLKQLADGTIPEDDFDDYSFDGDLEALFNDYLGELYDFGDLKVLNKKNEIEKFIWIK